MCLGGPIPPEQCLPQTLDLPSTFRPAGSSPTLNPNPVPLGGCFQHTLYHELLKGPHTLKHNTSLRKVALKAFAHLQLIPVWLMTF